MCWKPRLKSKYYIICPCSKKPDDTVQKYASSTIQKGCKSSLKIKSIRYNQMKIRSGVAKGKTKSYPNVEAGAPITISKANCHKI